MLFSAIYKQLLFYLNHDGFLPTAWERFSRQCKQRWLINPDLKVYFEYDRPQPFNRLQQFKNILLHRPISQTSTQLLALLNETQTSIRNERKFLSLHFRAPSKYLYSWTVSATIRII